MMQKPFPKQRLSIPQFLYKTYEIAENEETQDICSWSPNGDSFIIKNINQFCDKILLNYFKTNNFASFVRQLNMYGFHKMRNEANLTEFQHKQFRKGQKHLLIEIKRKQPTQNIQNQLLQNSQKNGKSNNSEDTNSQNNQQQQNISQQDEDSFYNQNNMIINNKQEYSDPNQQLFSNSNLTQFNNNNLNNPFLKFQSLENLQQSNQQQQNNQSNSAISQFLSKNSLLPSQHNSLNNSSQQQSQQQFNSVSPQSDLYMYVQRQKMQDSEIEKLKSINLTQMQELTTFKNKVTELETAMTVLISQHEHLISDNRLLWDEMKKQKDKEEEKNQKLLYTLMYFLNSGNKDIANQKPFNQETSEENSQKINEIFMQKQKNNSLNTSQDSVNSKEEKENDQEKESYENQNQKSPQQKQDQNTDTNANDNDKEIFQKPKPKQKVPEITTKKEEPQKEDWSSVRHFEKNGLKIPICKLRNQKQKESDNLNQALQIVKGILSSNPVDFQQMINKQVYTKQQTAYDKNSQIEKQDDFQQLLSKRKQPITSSQSLPFQQDPYKKLQNQIIDDKFLTSNFSPNFLGGQKTTGGQSPSSNSNYYSPQQNQNLQQNNNGMSFAPYIQSPIIQPGNNFPNGSVSPSLNK